MLNNEQKQMLYETILANLNSIAECEAQKKEFLESINGEIKRYQLNIDQARKSLNDDAIDTQMVLPMEGDNGKKTK